MLIVSSHMKPQPSKLQEWLSMLSVKMSQCTAAWQGVGTHRLLTFVNTLPVFINTL